MKRILILAVAVLFAFSSKAQGTPYSWTYTSKKISDNTYELHFRVDLNSPWHTYSQFTPDGGPVPTKFSFTKNPLYILNGKVNLVLTNPRYQEGGRTIPLTRGKIQLQSEAAEV
jgi:thiol:disulfide interchange protein DsbD